MASTLFSIQLISFVPSSCQQEEDIAMSSPDATADLRFAGHCLKHISQHCTVPSSPSTVLPNHTPGLEIRKRESRRALEKPPESKHLSKPDLSPTPTLPPTL